MNNEYLYTVTVTYDNVPSPQWIGRYSDALTAVNAFNEIVDWGFADEYSTVNLSEPSGKMHTRVFYREGRRVVNK
jgi:hypothetical protein